MRGCRRLLFLEMAGVIVVPTSRLNLHQKSDSVSKI